MMTSKVIISNLKRKEVSSILPDIKVFLSSTGGDSKGPEIYSILKSAYHFLKDFENSVPSPRGLVEIDEVISCTNDCVSFVKENCVLDETLKEQLITILYHIISVYLKLGKYDDSLTLASDVQKVFLKDYRATSDANNYARFLSAIFWNEALKLEKKNASNNFETCFKLRCQCVEFTLINNNLASAKEYISLTVIKYSYNNTESDSNKIICFLQNAWMHLSAVKESYDHMLFLFELLYSLFEFSVNYCKTTPIFNFLLSLISDLSEKVKKSSGTKDEINVFKSCLQISSYSIQIFFLKECVQVSASHISKYNKLFKDQTDLAPHTCAYFYLSLVKALNSSEIETIASFIKPNLAFCTTLTLQFLLIFPNLKFQERSPFNANSDITLVWAVVRVIYLLIKNETGGEDQKNLFKEAKNFIEATLKKLKTNSRNEEYEAKLSSYAKSIGNIGFSSYNCGYYSESIYFLETGLKFAIFDEAEAKKSYKWKEILVYCYLLSGNHKVALQYVASLMVNCKDKTKECFEMWHKVKAGALKNYNTALTSCTISDLVAEMKLKLSREEEISLLVEEFSGCKLERNSSEEEVLNIVKQLMRLQCSGIKWAYVMLVSITMGASRSQKISSLLNKSLLDMCLETVNEFETFVSENPTNSEAKIQLSIIYVWLYLIKFAHLHKLATKEVSTFSKPKSDEESESDIQPTIPLLTFLVEVETLKCLEKALDIWTEISSTSWSELAETVKHWDLLTLIQTSAEFFAISANDVLELRSLILLHTVSIAVRNKECELLSAISSINFFVQMGYLDLASHFLKINDISFYKGDEYNILKLKFYLAESNFFFHAGKFDEGLILLRQVFADNIFERLYKSVKILHIQAMLIRSKYLMIAPSGFTDIGNLEFLSSHTATSSAMDCAGAAKRLLKVLTEKTTFEGPHYDWVIQRTQTVKYLLKAYFLLGEHYMLIGDPRFARCFSLEGLKVAEENLLTYWSSKMLILLGKVDLMCSDLNDCTVKLNCLKYVMDENSKENAEMLLRKAFNNANISEPTEETEDYIIPIETRLKLPRAIKQNFINTNVHSSPIPLKTETNSKFEVKEETIPYSGRNTYYVYLIKLEMWALSCMQLITEDKKALAEEQLNKLLKKCELMRSTEFLKLISILKSSNVYWNKGSLTRVPSLPEKTLTVTALCKLSLLHFVKEEFESTNSCIDSALKILIESSNYGKHLHSITYGLLKYHQIVVSLKNIIKIKHDICLESALCPSVDIKGLATKRILQDSSILNMTPQKVVPKIQISPCNRKRIVKAPKKKDVLPAHIKEDIDNSAKSNEFPSLIFSSSDDEFLSVPPAPKKSSKKMCSSLSKRSENEENSYKLFDPKNVVLNINASSDIWKLADLSTPKSNKSSSERRTRQAVRNAKSENKSINSSKFLDPQLLSDRLMAVSRSTRSCSTKTSKLFAAQNSLEENKTWEHSVSEERRVSIEHYRGTSKTLQRKNVLEDIDMEEDVFFPDSSETVSNSGMQIKSSNGNQPSFLEKLCEDLTSMDITESSNAIAKHKIPEVKLTEFINELDEVRLLVQHIAPYPLYVNLCKLLAILTMLKNEDSPTHYDSAFLFSETFASVLRQIYLGQHYVFNTNKSADNTQFEFSRLLKRKDACIINQMESMLNVIPAGFTVVQINALFEKEIDKSSMANVSKLIICRYQSNTQPLVMGLDCSSSEMSTASIFADFSRILSESTLIMKNSDDRKKWWSTRTTLDGQLQSLVKGMEDFWLGCWKGLLLSSATTEKRKKNLKKIINSLCKLAEPSNKILLEVLLDSATFLSSEQLSAAICHLWKCKPLDNIFSQVWKLIQEKMPLELADTKRNPLVLILDKDLQALPWESLPILNEVPVSRMPSLNIMISKLNVPETKSALQEGLDCNNTYYILNPGGDLKYSEAYFQPIFKKQANWDGVIGKPPTAEECALALKNRDLFVYCGHGSGRQYLEGKTIDKMLCRASAILMGCSSGRLKQFEKQLESYGVPLTYLMNGSPCVVGNLWDVTDKDIDRFTDKLFELFVPNYKRKQKTTNVATAVSDARIACKMRYLVGSAPVIYGLPVFAKK